jgi:hypothetical protein
MHLTSAELQAGLETIRQAPDDGGEVHMIVRRPAVGERETVAEAAIDLELGLVGDTWKERGSSSTEDGKADLRAQLTVTSWRGINLVARSQDRVPLAGDQLYVDLNLSEANLPPGSKLAIGTAVLEVSDKPHKGCVKFKERFGVDALRFVNLGEGGELRLRGINTRVIEAGTVRVGDRVKVSRPSL